MPALRIFPTPPTQLSREHTASRFSSSASQHMPSSSGSLRLAVNRFSSTETQSWAASPPLARTDGFIPSVQNIYPLITCSGIKPDGERPHHAGPTRQHAGPTRQAPDPRAFKCVHSRALSIKAQPQADTCSHWPACRMCAGWGPGGDLSGAN